MARRSKKRWSDLSTGQRAGIAAAAGAQVALLVAALIDLRRRPASEVNGSKAIWTGVAFVNYLGPLAYFAFGRRK
jgi:hypothetical protein